MKYYRFIPAKAVCSLVLNALILICIVIEFTEKTSFKDIALIIIATAGFAGSAAAVVHEIKRVKKRGKCTYAVRAKCTSFQEILVVAENGAEVVRYSPKWNYSVWGREYEVQDKEYADDKPKIGSVKDMFADPENPNEFYYDKEPHGLFVLIGVISGAALTVSVSILILA